MSIAAVNKEHRKAAIATLEAAQDETRLRRNGNVAHVALADGGLLEVSTHFEYAVKYPTLVGGEMLTGLSEYDAMSVLAASLNDAGEGLAAVLASIRAAQQEPKHSVRPDGLTPEQREAARRYEP